MDWKSVLKCEYPIIGSRVLTYSEVYAKLDDIVNTYRILDAQFVRITTDVTHWTYLKGPDNNDTKSLQTTQT